MWAHIILEEWEEDFLNSLNTCPTSALTEEAKIWREFKLEESENNFLNSLNIQQQ